MTTLLAAPRTVARPRTFGPNWFAAVMGTGIVATAGATLPVSVPGLRTAATAVWALAATLLVVLTVAFLRHLRADRAAWRRYRHDPVLGHFWGAPPMALLTVGAGTLLLGADWIGGPAAAAAAAVLWTAGTLLGLLVALTAPRRTGDAFGGWVMPVVPPMVSAATGALLVPHAGADLRAPLLLACYAMAGLSLAAVAPVVRAVWRAPVRMAPTLWIVLGPAGQSVTAAHLLGSAADGTLPGASAFALLYGVPVLGFALLWMARAAALTVRAARGGLPFALTWWSFTFPVGTVVTGASGLAARTGWPVLTALAVLLYALLVVAWAVVGARTARGYLTGAL